ncbi:MAG: tyrosine-protein phosphatase [Bacteroidaceae bacterium]|nr:tyrosine-protein phosphatase [Bacteroidaceae bacterium]
MKKLITFLSMALVAIVTSAQTSVTVDGIKYNLDGSTATVTYFTDNGSEPGSSNPNNYTGSIVIPPTIDVDGTTYNVTAIGKKAFRSATITSISLPEGLLSIGKEAICKTNITEITVPSTVTSLAQYAIGQNSKLKTINIGESGGGSTWGEWVFWRSSGGYDVYMVCDIMPTLPDEYTFDDSHASKIYVKPELVDTYKADQWWGQHTILPLGTELVEFVEDGIKYKQTGDGEVSVTYLNDSKPGSSNPNLYTGDISIPAQVTHDGVTYNVTGIDNYAFRKANITSITLPEGLVSIGEEAITETHITEITLPNTLTTTGQYAMAYNQDLTTITCGSGSGTRTWGRWVFWRASTAYDVYMICDTKPDVPDIYTFDNDFASNIHIYPSLYLDYKTDYHWNCYNIVPDLVQEMSHEDLQTAIANFSAKLPADDEVGTDPGFYTTASVQAVKDALVTANALDESATAQQRNEALLQMIIAVDALQVNPLNEGYYYIESLYNNKYIRTTTDGYVNVKTFDASDTRFCFKLTRKGSNWIVRAANDETIYYFGAPDADGWVLSASAADNEQIITWLSGGKFKMQCLVEGTASSLYGQSSGYVFASSDYTEESNRAWWRFHPVQSGTFAQDFNIENIRVREYMAEVTYTAEDETKIKPYNVAPPARRDTPEPATIFWTQNASATAQQVTWSLNADFTDAFTAEVDLSDAHYEIYNLLPGQTYYYKVTLTVDGTPTEIINSSFTTSGQLRQIYAAGTGNMRDLGGWATASGKPIKYGLIYRGAEWNGEYQLTPEGVAALRAVGMKAELDLRIDWEAAYITTSPLGSDVTYCRITNEDYYESGMQNRKDLYLQDLQFIFDCVKNDKPVYFHCHIGADRTGTLAVILEGLLGVSESDMYKDYELTTFSYYETHRYKENIDGILEYIGTLEGETLTDKFYTYCHTELGLTAKEIADFRMKMLGTVYPTDVKNVVSEAVSDNTTSLDLSEYDFEAEALTDNLPAGTNLLITVSPESGITGQNIINDGVCESLVLTDGVDFGTPTAFTATQASFTTSVNTYKTLVLPFEAAVPEGFTASSAVSVTGTHVDFEETPTIGAGQPVMIEGTGELLLTASNAAVAATNEDVLTNGLFSGTYKSILAPVGSYVLQKQNGVIGFYQVAEGAQPTVKAFRAWLNAPASDIKAFYFGDDATSINEELRVKNEEFAPIYNLAGQRLQKMQKGVNVVNGKKVLF